MLFLFFDFTPLYGHDRPRHKKFHLLYNSDRVKRVFAEKGKKSNKTISRTFFKTMKTGKSESKRAYTFFREKDF